MGWVGASVDFAHGDLRVTGDGRLLAHADGTPFFYLGDTAWELFHRLTLAEAEDYLEDRRRKGFTVIQAVVVSEFDGLTTPNADGHLPFVAGDPARPDEAYFRTVDAMVDAAARRGICLGILPTWADKVGPRAWGTGPEGVFHAGNARGYGRMLGERLRDRPNVIWILGGDRPPEPPYLPVWRAMAVGLAEGDGGRHLRTYHPHGWHSSSEWLHGEPWMDFHMIQSSHGGRDQDNGALVARDRALVPPKPTLDAEARYENHPINWNPELGRFDDADVRQAAYWAVLAGACGHTYGCNEIYQFHIPGRPPVNAAYLPWREALDLPGAGQMLHLRRLLQSRPHRGLAPAPGIVAAGDGVRAARGNGYVLAYLPLGGNAELRLPAAARASWYDPRTGAWSAVEPAAAGDRGFAAPSAGRGHDWVLVLDDADGPD